VIISFVSDSCALRLSTESKGIYLLSLADFVWKSHCRSSNRERWPGIGRRYIYPSLIYGPGPRVSPAPGLFFNLPVLTGIAALVHSDHEVNKVVCVQWTAQAEVCLTADCLCAV